MATDDELVSNLACKDQSALEQIYGRYRSRLYSVALRITGDRTSAEEVLQDTFLQLWTKASQFDTSRGSLVGWLLAAVRHRAISRCRAKRRAFAGDSASVDALTTGGASALEQQIARELVSIALRGLSSVQREAITLAYFEGLTCEEISARMGTPLGTTKARMRAALQEMKAALNGARAPAKPRPAKLEDILVTDLLYSRPCGRRPSRAEGDCLLTLQGAISPQELVDSFLQIAIEQCGAGTVGLSLLETNAAGEPVFRWTNLVGELARCVGGTTPRNFSPCGVTLDRNSPQLFAYPARYFHYFNNVEAPIVEGLVIPFHIGNETHGTVWIVSHQKGQQFDSEDARVMTSLAEFVGCALHVSKSLSSRIEAPGA